MGKRKLVVATIDLKIKISNYKEKLHFHKYSKKLSDIRQFKKK